MDVLFRAFHGPTDWGWVQSHIPLKRVEDTNGIVAVDLDRNLTLAACIMDNWGPSSVCVHQIIEYPMVLRHNFFSEVARYVYDECGREVMIGLVPANNHKALKLNAKIGFQPVGVIPHGYDKNIDTVVLSMTKDQCNFYNAPMPEMALTGT